MPLRYHSGLRPWRALCSLFPFVDHIYLEIFQGGSVSARPRLRLVYIHSFMYIATFPIFNWILQITNRVVNKTAESSEDLKLAFA